MTANAWGENARLTELLWLCTADSGLSGFVGDDQAALGDRAGPTRWEPGQHGRYAKLIADQKTITRRRRPSRANLPAAGGGPAAAKGSPLALSGWLDESGASPPPVSARRILDTSPAHSTIKKAHAAAAVEAAAAAMGGDDGGDRPPFKFEQRQSRKSKIRFMGKVVVNLKNDRADKASIEALRGASFDATASQSQSGDLPTMDPKLLDSPRSPATPNTPSATPADEKNYMAELDKTRSHNEAVIRRSSQGDSFDAAPGDSFAALSDALTRSSFEATSPGAEGRRDSANLRQIWADRGSGSSFVALSRMSETIDAVESPRRSEATAGPKRRDSFADMERLVTAPPDATVAVDADAVLAPMVFPLAGALFFVDISGFTKLSGRLSADELKYHCNEYFGMLLGVIARHGGDVIKFLGDAFFVLWPAAPDAPELTKAANAWRAARCAVDVMRSCSTYDCGSGSSAVSLRLHCGLGVGIVNVFVVGADERWELVIAGDPIRQLAETEGEADRGQVVVSPEVQRLLSMGHVPYPVPLERTDGGNYQLRWAAEDDRPKDDKAFDDDAAPAEPEEKKKREKRPSLTDRLFGSAGAPPPARERRPSRAAVSLDGEPAAPSPSTKANRTMMFGSNASFDDGDLTAGPPPEGRRSIYEYVGPNNNSNAADSVRPQADRKKRKSISSLLLVHPPKTVETSSPDAGGGTLVYVPSDRAAFPPQTCEQARGSVHQIVRRGAWQLDPVAIGGPDEHDFAAIELAQKMRAAYSSLYDRDVVTVFVDVMGLEDALRAGDLGPVQAAMEAATHAFKHYKGMLRQFAVDDKGCVFIGVFGVPQHAHEDDEARAVGAALRVLASLATLGVDARASRPGAYCGLVGTAPRSEYAVLGSSVNLSARLMSHAPPNVLLVERNVRDGAIKSGGYAFHERGTIQAKGYDLPIAVFRPEKEVATSRAAEKAAKRALGERVHLSPRWRVATVGRSSERRHCRDVLAELRSSRSKATPVVTFLLGPRGFGKTRHLQEALALADQQGTRTLEASGKKGNVFGFLLRTLLSETAALASPDSSKRSLSPTHGKVVLAPIDTASPASPARPLGPRPTKRSFGLRKLEDLLAAAGGDASAAPLVQALVAAGPDDAVAGCRFSRGVGDAGERPASSAGGRGAGALTGATADAYGALKQLLRGGEGGLRARTFALKPLNPREAADFARDVFFGAPEQDGAPVSPSSPKKRSLTVDDPDPAFAEELAKKTGGDPHKVLHVALVLKQRLGGESLARSAFPGAACAAEVASMPSNAVQLDLRRMVIARFDALSQLEQAVLKSASVLGRDFCFSALLYLFRQQTHEASEDSMIAKGDVDVGNDRAISSSLRFALVGIIEHNFVRKRPSPGGDAFAGAFAFVKDTVHVDIYELMPVLTRQKLHGFAAAWTLERAPKPGARELTDLVHHCLNSGRRHAALEHLVALAAGARADPRRHDEAVLAYSLLVQLCLSVDAFELLEARAAGPHAAEAFLAETDAGPFDAAWRDRTRVAAARGRVARGDRALERSAGRVATAFNTASAALVVLGDAADADGHGAAVKSRLHALRSELFLARGLADDARRRRRRGSRSCAPDLAARAKRTGEPTDEAAPEAAGFALYSARFDAVDAAPALPLRSARRAVAARLAAVHAATGDAKRAAATLRVARRDASRAGTRARRGRRIRRAHYGCLGAWDRCLDHGARAAAAHEAAGEPNRAAEERVARAHAHLAVGCANRAVAALHAVALAQQRTPGTRRRASSSARRRPGRRGGVGGRRRGRAAARRARAAAAPRGRQASGCRDALELWGLPVVVAAAAVAAPEAGRDKDFTDRAARSSAAPGRRARSTSALRGVTAPPRHAAAAVAMHVAVEAAAAPLLASDAEPPAAPPRRPRWSFAAPSPPRLGRRARAWTTDDAEGAGGAPTPRAQLVEAAVALALALDGAPPPLAPRARRTARAVGVLAGGRDVEARVLLGRALAKLPPNPRGRGPWASTRRPTAAAGSASRSTRPRRRAPPRATTTPSTSSPPSSATTPTSTSTSTPRRTSATGATGARGAAARPSRASAPRPRSARGRTDNSETSLSLCS
ncbi:adenylate cyclase [Aureococcus anophagefferens]|nr:adenylate cyclase [Aureococcus anophagefferens]